MWNPVLIEMSTFPAGASSSSWGAIVYMFCQTRIICIGVCIRVIFLFGFRQGLIIQKWLDTQQWCSVSSWIFGIEVSIGVMLNCWIRRLALGVWSYDYCCSFMIWAVLALALWEHWAGLKVVQGGLSWWHSWGVPLPRILMDEGQEGA